MSIRARLVIMCLVVALLPAVPLTFLVQSLLDKSFDVGLSSTVEDALQSGLNVSRERFDAMRADFQDDVVAAVGAAEPVWRDSAAVAAEFEARRGPRDGFIMAARASGGDDDLPVELRAFSSEKRFRDLVDDARIVGPRYHPGRGDVAFFETDNRVVQLATWRRATGPALFFRQTDPDFLYDAERLITGRQIFAQLRLSRGGLARSFFYPFVVIYAVSVILALALALLISERLSDPLRRLVRGATAVAAGDWTHRVEAARAGGETKQLVGAFNSMVSSLNEQQRRLVDVERMAAWRDVARHLAHEIKNPLLPIRLTVEEIRDQYRGDDAQYREFLAESTRVVGDEVAHLQQLVKSFSAFAKMPELKRTRGSLEALIADVVRLYPQIATTVGGTTPDVDFDADQMRRVVVNLFDNVVAVAGDGAAVTITLGVEAAHAVLAFADDGPGIPEEDRTRIFEPYFTTRTDGSGLGLAMLKNIVLMHGGTVDVESSVGNGATFIIRLPLPSSFDQREDS